MTVIFCGKRMESRNSLLSHSFRGAAFGGMGIFCRMRAGSDRRFTRTMTSGDEEVFDGHGCFRLFNGRMGRTLSLR
jgi:hypothetical protein